MDKKIINILLFFLFSSYLSSQKLNYQTFTNITPHPESSSVYCFTQDTQGLMWIGTNKGLFSYDGYSAQQHFLYGERSNTLIHAILADNEHRLFLGTDNGVLIYNYKSDRYEKTDIEFLHDVRAMAKQGNTLWIGSLNGLFKYNIITKRLENVSEKPHVGLPHNTIYSIITSKDNTLYVGTYNGFCKYIPELDRFEVINLPSDVKRSNQFVNSLLEDSNSHTIWIGTEGALYKYSPVSGKVEEVNSFRDNSIKSLTMDGDNNLVLATDNGLYAYSETTGDVFHFVHDSRNNKSLSNNIIWGVFTDKEKNVWLGTDYGVSLSQFNKSLQLIPISQITGIGDGNRFYSIFKDSRGNFWFGGTNGLIVSPSLTERSDKSIWYRMGDPKYPISHNRIRHIYEDKDNNLWIATDGSLNRYDYEKKQFVHYTIVDSTHTLNSNWAYNIFEDNNQNLWIATCLGGIFVVNKEKLLNSSGTYVAEKNYSTRNGLSGNFVNQIVPDNKGNVWALLYNNGINKIDQTSGVIEEYPLEKGVSKENLNYIISDKNGYIWASLRGGIVRVNAEDNSSEFIKLHTFSGNEILSMIEIDKDIWISTTEGVWILNKESHEVQRLDIPNGFFTSFYLDKSSGKMYMGGVDQFAILSPDIPKQKSANFHVVLTALYVNDKLFSAGVDYEGNSIRYLDHIELSYKQNSLSFEFSDFIYSGGESGKFSYRLEGLDKDWNILKQDANRITYTNLDYGDYKLTITRLDSSGKPSDVFYSFGVQITPPWYYTIWAKGLYILLLLGLILWTINFFRVRNNLRIERIEKEKTVELTNLKIDFFTNVSHEFKTPLSLIIAPISKLLLETKDPIKKRSLEAVQRNALKLNSLIRQVLEFNRTDSSTNSNLLLSKVEFVEFSKSLFSIYEEGYKDKHLAFYFSSNQPKIYINMDVLKMESVLNNLVANACKFTKEGGRVELKLNCKEESNMLDVEISDTGIGIPKREKTYVFERYYQSSKTAKDKDGTGIGLYLAKIYTEQHGGQINLESEEDRGTSITLSLPLFFVVDDSNLEEEPTHDIADEKKPLILIVDDNPEIADFIRQTLNRKYRCEVAHNGKMGLEIALKDNPNLIVADIMMPVMDGLEMSRRIKKNVPTSTIPIILLTAKDDKSTELESINLNVDAFISKPFDPDLLLSRIEQLLTSKLQIEAKLRIETITTPKSIDATSPDEKFLSEIIGIIEDKIADPDLNVNTLSTVSSIGSKQLYRKLKQLTGMSPVEYIRSIRLKKAAMLLSQKKFTISEVMYMVGFSNHSYFAKCFQQEFGKTPRKFVSD